MQVGHVHDDVQAAGLGQSHSWVDHDYIGVPTITSYGVEVSDFGALEVVLKKHSLVRFALSQVLASLVACQFYGRWSACKFTIPQCRYFINFLSGINQLIKRSNRLYCRRGSSYMASVSSLFCLFLDACAAARRHSHSRRNLSGEQCSLSLGRGGWLVGNSRLQIF